MTALFEYSSSLGGLYQIRPTFCLNWSGSKMFAKVFLQKTLPGKEKSSDLEIREKCYLQYVFQVGRLSPPSGSTVK